jgi:hypothetical protein
VAANLQTGFGQKLAVYFFWRIRLKADLDFTTRRYPSAERHLPFLVKPLTYFLTDDLKVAHEYGGTDGA